MGTETKSRPLTSGYQLTTSVQPREIIFSAIFRSFTASALRHRNNWHSANYDKGLRYFIVSQRYSLELVLWIHFIQIRLYLFEHKHCLSVLPFKILRTIIKIQHRDASMIHKTSGCSRYFGSLTCLFGAFFEISHLPCPRLISHLKCSNIFRFSSNKSCHYKPNTLFIMPDVWAIFWLLWNWGGLVARIFFPSFAQCHWLRVACACPGTRANIAT